MAFLDRFFRKQKKEKLEKQVEKQQKEIAKDLKLTKKIQESKKEEDKKVKITKHEDNKKESVKIGTRGAKPKFQVDVHNILIKPLITEKISDMAILGKYAFKVATNANKIMVKKAVSTLYGVKVRDVKIINIRGKKVRYGRQSGRRPDWRKAIVTLAPGEKIEIYEGV